VTAAPGSTDCKTPFSDARAIDIEKLAAPLGENISTQVLVEVIVDATGAVADAWVYAPSGHSTFDDAALDSAKNSKFAAGSAFCKPAPERYMFRATFNHTDA
jgi:TonB family protein